MYEIKIDSGIDETKQQPYYVNVKIKFEKKEFQKRLENLCKEKHFVIDYGFQKVNEGTFFKQNIKQKASVLIREKSNPMKDLAIEIIMPFSGTDLFNKSLASVKSLWGFMGGRTFYFTDKENKEEFVRELEKSLTYFLEHEKERYEELLKKKQEERLKKEEKLKLNLENLNLDKVNKEGKEMVTKAYDKIKNMKKN